MYAIRSYYVQQDVDGEILTVTFRDYALNGQFYLAIDQFPSYNFV